MKKFRKFCIGCEKPVKKMTKEHFWPKWMIKHTNMQKTKIGWWNGTEVYPLTATIPLCGPCNHSLGSKLEAPMQQIFLDLENRKGMSDNEAETFIRWCWKMEGFSWRLFEPEGEYSEVYTVTERALQNIDNIRPGLVLAIAFVKDYCEGREYKPMGLCNVNEINAIVVSGVISSVAFMVLTDDQVGNLPINFSYYRLSPERSELGDIKVFFPEAGFEKFSDARDLTRRASALISHNIDVTHNKSSKKDAQKARASS